MATHPQFAKSSWRCIQCRIQSRLPVTHSYRAFHLSATPQVEVDTAGSVPEAPPPRPLLDPHTISTPRLERKLFRETGQHPIGSRRRRAALQNSANIPFEQLPYQCFQEARKLLQTDREEKLAQIEEERRRIAKVQATPAEQYGGEHVKKGRLIRMQHYLEELKILADTNDPVIKKRFEDGAGDMNRPIYRFLANRQWRQYRRLVLMQRISQMHVVPDVISYLDPTAEVELAFGRRNVQPGDFVDSGTSEAPPQLKVQVFDKGERFVSIAVVDPDVPNLDTDSFDSRCHFLATNIPVSPTLTSISLSDLSSSATIIRPWLPPHAQKGSPYHRLAVFILEHKDGKKLESKQMDNGQNVQYNSKFNMQSLTDKLHSKVIGIHLFRTIWDDATAGVMERAGIAGGNIELKRKKSEKLPYKKKDGARDRAQHDLWPTLSRDARIYFHNNADFANLTERWSVFSEGDIAVVIEPATTQDVAAAVKFANHYGLPFLAVNGGHGSTSSLNTIQHGVSINLQKLKKIQIAADGHSAILGGGVNTHEVVNTLAASNKVTATTNGGCTGQLGPAMGGGFGRYMGFFGLVMDSIIDMTVVLADGAIVHVSATSHPDLYWAMKGAGQNFGIVTEATFQIYDFPTPHWFYAELTYANASSQLEPLFTAINEIDTNGSQPKELGTLYTVFAIDPTYSKTDVSRYCLYWRRDAVVTF
ncbi:MAG: hypothetical protein Q9222_005779 [Ikaeria aurantiellina]